MVNTPQVIGLEKKALPMRNFKLLLEYDGARYVGWQRQENGRSVQGEIEQALAQILQEPVSLLGAGRTDAGVHARGQVANFRARTNILVDHIRGGLNGLLPDDITVHKAEEVPIEFHARYGAKGRLYSYSIVLSPSAIERHYSWYVKYSLNLESMARAAQLILGLHDFEPFSKANSGVAHYRCKVGRSAWVVQEMKLRYEVQADRFVHGMVRSLVGTMVDVGRGYLSLQDFESILAKMVGKKASVFAPAKGLVLERVFY